MLGGLASPENTKLKSDLRGIETILVMTSALLKLQLKSDLRGIETSIRGIGSPCVFKVKIRS